MKEHISSLLGYSQLGHSQFDFVDINVLDDQKLFIDPCLLSTSQDEWCKNAAQVLEDFFDKFYEAYRNNDTETKIKLLSHASEINYTRLGYGNGENGHGNTSDGLIATFTSLETLVVNNPFITKAMDLPVYVPGFSEDGLSDMITNIIHKQLNDYTLEQLEVAGKNPNSEDTFYTWDITNSDWKEITCPCYRYLGRDKILLTPKKIVRKRYFFNVNQFLMRVILERAKNETAYTNEKGKISFRTTKKALKNAIQKVDRRWRYSFTKTKSIEDPSYIKDYHNVIPNLYYGRGMSDLELDNFIY